LGIDAVRMPMKNAELDALLNEVRRCQICAADLPLGPRPVLRASPSSRILIVGQAPSTKVHESGVPWNDASGDRLRDWLEVERDVFYDENQIAIVLMGFCYPRRADNGGDKPPRPECAPLWHARLLDMLPRIELTLLVGGYAQRYYLQKSAEPTLTATVSKWQEYLPRFFPLPHPSWGSRGWASRNPWFEKDVVPDLRRLVEDILAPT